MREFATATEEILEQPGSAACDWNFRFVASSFIRKVRSEIRSTPAWVLVIVAEAGPPAGILLSAAACANICTPANNRTGTSNRIKLDFPFILILWFPFVLQILFLRFYIQR
jgi:hypothetical protein